MIAQLARRGNVTPQAEAALSVLGMFDDMEAYGTMKGGTMIVNMVDKEQNSFKTICGKTGAADSSVRAGSEFVIYRRWKQRTAAVLESNGRFS